MNAEAELTELVLGYGGWLQPQPRLTPRPGQYVVASRVDMPEVLPQILFPAAYAGAAWLAADPLPASWQPGARLHLRGPLGHGFHLPSNAHRVALAGLGQPLSRLLPLVELALEQGAAVALCGVTLPAGLASAVEVLPPESLPELAAWADYLALDLPISSLENLRPRLGLEREARPAAKIEVLVRVPMPCAGLGDCGICAVPIRKGWQPACTAGPVFDLEDFD